MGKNLRFSSTEWKFLDKVKSGKNNVTLEYDSKYLVDRIIGIYDVITGKQIAHEIGMMLYYTVAPYVPRGETDTLLTKGMHLRTTNKYGHAEIDLKVRNTKKVPYALYQYYGVVYGPNYATWSMDKMDRRKKGAYTLSYSPAKHVGWVSPKGKGTKHPTKNKIGEPRTIDLKDGRQIIINGYSNPNSHARWLEYVRTNSSIWVPFTKEVTRGIRETWDLGWKGKEKIWTIRMRYVQNVTSRLGNIEN